jgi:Holliday junction resolvase
VRYVKRDANHAQIATVLKAFGASVYDAAHAGRSFPDLVVGLGGVTFLVEIKAGEKAPVTDGQQAFADTWRGSPVVFLRSKVEAVEWATRTRHELRRKSDAKALAACVHRHSEEGRS